MQSTRLVANLKNYQAIRQNDPLYTEFRGALTENFALTELVTRGHKPYFWRSKQEAEIDFICRFGQNIIPIEVKSETRGRSRSLTYYIQQYNPEIALRLSTKNTGVEPPLFSVPLYLISRLNAWFS